MADLNWLTLGITWLNINNGRYWKGEEKFVSTEYGTKKSLTEHWKLEVSILVNTDSTEANISCIQNSPQKSHQPDRLKRMSCKAKIIVTYKILRCTV